MRIVYIVDFFRTINAGTEKQLGYLMTYLPTQGHTVGLISFQDSPFLSHEARAIFPGVKIRTLGTSSDISKSPKSLLRLWKHLRHFRPDIVHTCFPASNSIGAIISRLAGVRTVITSRRDMGFNLTRKDLFLLKLANRWVSGIIANAAAVKEKTARDEHVNAEKIQVIYNGIDLDKNMGEFSESKNGIPVVGIVANLNRPVKRVDVFIRAAARVHSDFPDAKFWVVGDGHLRAELEALARESGFGEAITFLGRRNDVDLLLKEFTVGVICSDSEGLSNAIMEYMAAGIPTVATNTGGNPELIQHGETGYITAPGDDKVLAFAVGSLLSAPEKALSMGRKAWLQANRDYSVDKMIGATLCIYQKTARSKAHICTNGT